MEEEVLIIVLNAKSKLLSETFKSDNQFIYFEVFDIDTEIENKIIIKLKYIEDNKVNTGKYRLENVKISGASQIPMDYIKVPEEMESLIHRYENWNQSKCL